MIFFPLATGAGAAGASFSAPPAAGPRSAPAPPGARSGAERCAPAQGRLTPPPSPPFPSSLPLPVPIPRRAGGAPGVKFGRRWAPAGRARRGGGGPGAARRRERRHTAASPGIPPARGSPSPPARRPHWLGGGEKGAAGQSRGAQHGWSRRAGLAHPAAARSPAAPSGGAGRRGHPRAAARTPVRARPRAAPRTAAGSGGGGGGDPPVLGSPRSSPHRPQKT